MLQAFSGCYRQVTRARACYWRGNLGYTVTALQCVTQYKRAMLPAVTDVDGGGNIALLPWGNNPLLLLVLALVEAASSEKGSPSRERRTRGSTTHQHGLDSCRCGALQQWRSNPRGSPAPEQAVAFVAAWPTVVRFVGQAVQPGAGRVFPAAADHVPRKQATQEALRP